MNQIVTLPESRNISNARNYKGEKFLTRSLKLLAIKHTTPAAYSGGEPVIEIAELCVWTGVSPTASRFYASLWVHADPYHISGHGTAGGYGYCKASAASCAAFYSAGLVLSRDFAGAGMSEVEKALYALGASLGYCRKLLYVVRGV